MDYSHVHRTEDGGLEQEYAGRLTVCTERLCFTWESRNARVVNTVGGGAIGAIVGGLVGTLFDRPAEGALVGAGLGATAGYTLTPETWNGERLNGLPVLGPHRSGRGRSRGSRYPARA